MQIKLLMISFKKIFYNLFVIIILLFFTDFFFGKYIFNYLNKKNIEQLFLLSKKYDSTESHPVYNHTFKKNYSGKDSYGQFEFYTCTNNYGFRVGCDNKKDNIKNFDFAIIGDSSMIIASGVIASYLANFDVNTNIILITLLVYILQFILHT